MANHEALYIDYDDVDLLAKDGSVGIGITVRKKGKGIRVAIEIFKRIEEDTKLSIKQWDYGK